ncbi:hypothetical protein D9M72_363870 [compost metagenome]
MGDVTVGESPQGFVPHKQRLKRADDVVVNDVRDVVAQHHLETLVTDVPRHGFLTDGSEYRFEVVQLQQGRSVRNVPGRDDCCCGAIGEQGRAHDGVGVVGGADVKGTKLRADNQDNGVRVCLAERLGGTQRRKRRVTAHEAEVVALHGRTQAQGTDDLVVRAGVEETRA